MPNEDLRSIINTTSWTFLSEGAYNRVFVSTDMLTMGHYTGRWVLKQPLSYCALVLGIVSEQQCQYLCSKHSIIALFVRSNDRLQLVIPDIDTLLQVLISSDLTILQQFDQVFDTHPIEPNKLNKLTNEDLKKIISIVDVSSYVDVILKSKEMNTCTRAIRKWNRLNPAFPAFQIDDTWITPYFPENMELNDQTIADAIIRYYRETRCIIIDGCGFDNFKWHEGEAICIDVDLALERGSEISEQYMETVSDDTPNIKLYLDHYSQHGRRETVSTIRNLIYLEHCLSTEEIQDDYLTPEFIKKIGYFRYMNLIITANQLNLLFLIIKFSSQHIELENVVFLIAKKLYTTPLMYAVDKKDAIMFQKIMNDIQHMSTPAAKLDMLNAKNIDGVTALILAVFKDNQNMLCSLIKAGANINQTTNSCCTALIYATMHKYTFMISTLLHYNADIESRTDDGQNALDIAIIQCPEMVIDFLLAMLKVSGEKQKRILAMQSKKQHYTYENVFIYTAINRMDFFNTLCKHVGREEPWHTEMLTIKLKIKFLATLKWDTWLMVIKNEFAMNQLEEMKTFYQALLHARNTMLLTQLPMIQCVQNFQKQCETILLTSDETLIKPHYKLWWPSFFYLKKELAFLKQYQDFKQSINKITLDIKDEYVMVTVVASKFDQ